jgi:quinol monooxygenase YgiN
VRTRTFAVSVALLFASAVSAQAPNPASGPTAPLVRGSAPATASEATTFVVKFKIKPGREADFEQAFHVMGEGVRQNEPGNIYYELYRTSEDPHTYVIIEHYKDTAAVAAHGRSPHAQKLMASLRDLLDGPPQAQRLIFVSSK